jgi:hypothetical protein
LLNAYKSQTIIKSVEQFLISRHSIKQEMLRLEESEFEKYLQKYKSKRRESLNFIKSLKHGTIGDKFIKKITMNQSIIIASNISSKTMSSFIITMKDFCKATTLLKSVIINIRI